MEKIAQINKTKIFRFFEKIKKIDKPLAGLIKKKREKNKINKIRKRRGYNNAEMKRIIRDYYEQPYGNKMDSLKKWTDF